jgi:ABC-2 type transport system ATP-binding protein
VRRSGSARRDVRLVWNCHVEVVADRPSLRFAPGFGGASARLKDHVVKGQVRDWPVERRRYRVRPVMLWGMLRGLARGERTNHAAADARAPRPAASPFRHEAATSLAARVIDGAAMPARPLRAQQGGAAPRRDPLIVVEGVEKAFGSVVALAGVDLVVERGTVLGLLGRNGAGKSTLVRVLSTLLLPDAGRAWIAGVDVVRDAQRVRARIGLAGQAAAVDPTLTGRENLELVGRLYGLRRREARARAHEVLERLSLTAAADRRVFTYSGGMRRRLDLGASLVGKPLVLIMDEPTTGLDPRTRLELWKFVDDLVREGTTVLLTTQYLEEADRLADRIAVIDRGSVVATGTATELKQRVGGDVLELRARTAVDVERLRRLLAGLGSAEPVADTRWQRITLPTNRPIETLLAAARLIRQAGIAVDDLGLRRPSLDDVFLSLTGSQEAVADGVSAGGQMNEPLAQPSEAHR